MTPAPIEVAAMIIARRMGTRGAVAHCMAYARRAERRKDDERLTYFLRVAAFLATCDSLGMDPRRASIRSVA